jgi:hypothetical protein
MKSLFEELRKCCEKIGFNFERAKKEVEELIRDLGVEVIDYFITTDVPIEYFEGTLMDVCVLSNKALLGYEIKRGNVSLFHVLPLNKLRIVAQEIRVEKENKYLIADFRFGDMGGLATSTNVDNQESMERLRRFLRRVASQILGKGYEHS